MDPVICFMAVRIQRKPLSLPSHGAHSESRYAQFRAEVFDSLFFLWCWDHGTFQHRIKSKGANRVNEIRKIGPRGNVSLLRNKDTTLFQFRFVAIL